MNIRPLIALTLLVLAGCSSGTISTPPTPEEAQAAINAEPSGMAVAGQKPPTLYVTDVKLGTCTSSQTIKQIVCDTNFNWQGSPVQTRVAFWPSPNPRHPWRAKFVTRHQAGR